MEISDEQAWQICELTKLLNDQIREHFGQPKSDVPMHPYVIRQVIGTPLDPKGKHNKWCKDRIKDGYKAGPYSVEKKTHPNLGIVYDKLPFEEKLKDYVFLTVVETCRLILKNNGVLKQ